MKPQIILLTAITSLGANKLRALLTLLGIVIGIAAVISLLSIGQGVQDSITDRIQSLGTNLLFVRPGGTMDSGISGAQGSAGSLTLEDAYALENSELAPAVKLVAPQLSTNGQVIAGGKNTFTQIAGVTPEYQLVRDFTTSAGQFINSTHIDRSSQVVVLGSSVAEDLFGFRTPVGQSVRIQGRQFVVIGVLESKGGGVFGSFDDLVVAPISTVYNRLSSSRTTQGDVSVQSINVQAVDVESMDEAEEQVATVLRFRHRITGDDDFTISSQQDTIETLEDTTNTFIVFLGTIAGISLLVGGIGIMNIMLVTVTERTREIGIRKAMGAKRRDIMLQFLSEASVLSLSGGALGLALGAFVAWFLDGQLIGGQPFRTSFSTDFAVLALVVGAGIGLFFGIYPAVRAARLHPIDALRYE